MSTLANASWPIKAAVTAGAAAAVIALFLFVGSTVMLMGLGLFTGQLDLLALPSFALEWGHEPEIRKWALIGAGAGIAAPAGLAVAIFAPRRRALHGAARWAREPEIKREGLRADTGILLGRKGGRILTFGGSEHVMLYAPTRSGKGVGVVIPNLMNWPDSVVVLDVKKENWKATAGFRARHGQQVVHFDPLDRNGLTARYNPFTYVDRDDPVQRVDELQKIAAMLFISKEKEDPFWTETARSGFVGVASYVAETPELPFTVGEVFRQLTAGGIRERFPATIAERKTEGRPLSEACTNALMDFCSASENTFASIKITITSRMNLWLNPLVDAATSESDIDLRDLRRKRMSIYLGVTPDNLVRIAPIYNLFFQQLVDLNTRDLPEDNPDLRLQVLLLLDEFAQLGRAEVIAKGFSYVAGYGLRLLPVLQSPAQLRAIYGPDVAEEIITNCGVEICFTPKDLKIAQHLSERIGYLTHKGRSISKPIALTQGRRSMTENESRRALMMPQELMQMSKDKLIVLRGGIPPVLGKKIAYYKERGFTQRVLPPPELESRRPRGQAAQPSASDAVTVINELRSIKAAVAEIQTKLSERPMTEDELSGKAELSLDSLSLNYEGVDLSPPAKGAAEGDFQAWAMEYLEAKADEHAVA